MDFAFTEDQIEFRDAVRALLQEHCTADAVRTAWTNDTGRIPGLWDRLVEMGVVAITAPESANGMGLTVVDLVLILEESGRFALPEPLVETTAVAIPLLAAVGDDRVGALAEGAAVAVVSPRDQFAVWADSAAWLLLLGQDGARFIATDSLDLTAARSVDGARRLSSISFAPEGENTLGDATLAHAAFDRGVLGVAAQQCGLAQRMIELSVDYAKERQQFGVAIGSFQAVKHHLANARLALEFARPLVYRAAYSIATDHPEVSAHVSMAKSSADDAALLAGRVALQCHGAIGYTTEYDLHLYMKRAWALARSWGDATWQRARVGHALSTVTGSQ